RHALGKMFQTLAQQCQRTPRMLCAQAGVEPCQALLARAKATVDAAQQALLQIVDALGLLLQALAGMAQAAGQTIEARAFTMQAFAHAQQQALAQACQALANIRTAGRQRSEEHTSELQSRENLVCRLLLEKKKEK